MKAGAGLLGPSSGAGLMGPSQGDLGMDDDPMPEPSDLFVDLGMLILEGRKPERSVKGRVEGEHCPSPYPDGKRHQCAPDIVARVGIMNAYLHIHERVTINHKIIFPISDYWSTPLQSVVSYIFLKGNEFQGSVP